MSSLIVLARSCSCRWGPCPLLLLPPLVRCGVRFIVYLFMARTGTNWKNKRRALPFCCYFPSFPIPRAGGLARSVELRGLAQRPATACPRLYDTCLGNTPPPIARQMAAKCERPYLSPPPSPQPPGGAARRVLAPPPRAAGCSAALTGAKESGAAVGTCAHQAPAAPHLTVYAREKGAASSPVVRRACRRATDQHLSAQRLSAASLAPLGSISAASRPHLGRIPAACGKTFQKRSVSSPAPVHALAP